MPRARSTSIALDFNVNPAHWPAIVKGFAEQGRSAEHVLAHLGPVPKHSACPSGLKAFREFSDFISAKVKGSRCKHLFCLW